MPIKDKVLSTVLGEARFKDNHPDAPITSSNVYLENQEDPLWTDLILVSDEEEFASPPPDDN